jgi:hypothetical protein
MLVALISFRLAALWDLWTDLDLQSHCGTKHSTEAEAEDDEDLDCQNCRITRN